MFINNTELFQYLEKKYSFVDVSSGTVAVILDSVQGHSGERTAVSHHDNQEWRQSCQFQCLPF